MKKLFASNSITQMTALEIQALSFAVAFNMIVINFILNDAEGLKVIIVFEVGHFVGGMETYVVHGLGGSWWAIISGVGFTRSYIWITQAH